MTGRDVGGPTMLARAWRTPLGASIEGVVARLLAGDRATVRDPREGYELATIAPIQDEPARSRQGRFLRRMGLFGLEVASEALAASRVGGGVRVGLFSGVGGLRAHWDDMLAALADQRDDGTRLWERGLKDVHPYWMLRHLSNNVHALASAELDLRGEGATFGGGNGGAQALAAASRALRDGAIDAALVVAYDSLLEPETMVELGARGVRCVPGEAAAAIVLARDGAGPRVTARDAAGPGALAWCREALVWGAQLVDGDGDDASPGIVRTELAAAMGDVGAATALVQAIALSELLRAEPLVPGGARVALGLHASAPDLASAVRVEVHP
jgi:3-oxoacyl-[acyl-carrier-protein] synthase II